jgi:hypothetical protein
MRYPTATAVVANHPRALLRLRAILLQRRYAITLEKEQCNRMKVFWGRVRSYFIY